MVIVVVGSNILIDYLNTKIDVFRYYSTSVGDSYLPQHRQQHIALPRVASGSFLLNPRTGWLQQHQLPTEIVVVVSIVSAPGAVRKTGGTQQMAGSKRIAHPG